MIMDIFNKLHAIVSAQLLASNEAEFDIYAFMSFWDSPYLAQWLQEQGYTLYSRCPIDEGVSAFTAPNLPFDNFRGANYPFAYHNALTEENDLPSLRGKDHSGKIAFAQDSHGRHFAIKMLLKESEEHKILRFLSRQSLETLRGNCVLPVLNLLYFRDLCFAVMPRWGSKIYFPRCHTMPHGIIRIMQSMLKGLAFLHAHNIIHRDIKMENVVVNHFGPDDYNADYFERQTLLLEGRLSYAMIDYSISMMLPAEAKRGQFRLPYRESYLGSYFPPSDTRQGEFDYDPFAFDVGTMGVAFCRYYQRYTKIIPMLAPFLDRMITRDISKRFTASEALQFLEDMVPLLTEKQLMATEYPGQEEGTYESYDRWAGLPADFQEEWAAYREPLGVPLMSRILRSIMENEQLPNHIIPWTRWFFSRLISIPCLIWKRSIGFLAQSTTR